jgi:hypothetical protein
MKVLHEPYLGVAAVERRRWQRRRPVKTVAVATGIVESGVDLESFGMKSEITQGRLLFIGSKISTVVLV